MIHALSIMHPGCMSDLHFLMPCPVCRQKQTCQRFPKSDKVGSLCVPDQTIEKLLMLKHRKRCEMPLQFPIGPAPAYRAVFLQIDSPTTEHQHWVCERRQLHSLQVWPHTECGPDIGHVHGLQQNRGHPPAINKKTARRQRGRQGILPTKPSRL